MSPTQFCEYIELVMKPTLPLFQLVPNNQIQWKPTEHSFTCGQLLYHIAYSLRFNANGIGKNIWELPSMRHIFLANRKTPEMSVEEAMAFYETTYKEFYSIFPAMSEEEFLTREVDSPQFGKIQVWKIALFSVSHHLNHKTELFMYLKLLGINVGSKELYGI